MEQFAIQLTPPIGTDKALRKAHEKLAAEVAELAGNRRRITNDVRDLSDGKHGERSELERTKNRAKIIRWEIELLDREIPMMQRVVDDYLPTAHAARLREIEVAGEMIPLARAHVLSIFDRDFDPQTWPRNEAALNHWIEHHPVVRGVQENYEQLRDSLSQNPIHSMRDVLARAQSHLAQLKRELPGADQAASRAMSDADRKAQQAATERMEAQLAEDRRRDAQKKNADEARKRLNV